MRSAPTPFFYLAAAVTASTIFCVYMGFASLRDVQPSEATDRLWGLLYKILLAGWIISDSEGRTNISRPFCFGFLLLIFGELYAPYYLLKTRGGAGVLWVAGGFGLLFAGYLVPLFVRGAS